ncbi:MAG TPA: TetR/AcrR family transcriptional regulator [Novosphingobium sp.]|nr:TetR/AcrR family transcriptional regulator [Novosphingobium sp.]
MNVRDEQRDKVTERLAAHLLETGLARTSLRQLAAAAGVSDRMLLYYFADKAEVLTAVMARVAGELTVRLAAAIPEGEPLGPGELVRRAASFTTGTEMRRFMRLWVEVVAAAAKGEQPFVAIASQIMAGFRAWVDSRLALPPGADREAMAAAIIAVVDGLALVDICSDDVVTQRMPAALAILLRD